MLCLLSCLVVFFHASLRAGLMSCWLMYVITHMKCDSVAGTVIYGNLKFEAMQLWAVTFQKCFCSYVKRAFQLSVSETRPK